LSHITYCATGKSNKQDKEQPKPAAAKSKTSPAQKSASVKVTKSAKDRAKPNKK